MKTIRKIIIFVSITLCVSYNQSTIDILKVSMSSDTHWLTFSVVSSSTVNVPFNIITLDLFRLNWSKMWIIWKKSHWIQDKIKENIFVYLLVYIEYVFDFGFIVVYCVSDYE